MFSNSALFNFYLISRQATILTQTMRVRSREKGQYGMYNLRQANGFQGVDLVLSDEELNALIEQINKLIIQFKDKAELEEMVDKLHSLKKVLCEFAYYDENEREVHCRMGYYELQLMIECIIVALPKSENDVFAQMLMDANTKRWVYKAQGEN